VLKRSSFFAHDSETPEKVTLRTAALYRATVGFPHERADTLARRAGRLRQKGDLRRAAVALREACAISEEDAARWMMLGHLELRLGKARDAERAMKQALFLRERDGEKGKAQVVRRLLLSLGCAERPWL
jgi:Flp pilus assembly protein TadD